MLTVVVADDQRVFAEALTAVLGAERDLRVLPCVGSAGELRRVLDTSPVDVVVLEPSLYGDDGIDAVEQVIGSPCDPQVLVVSANAEAERVADALSAGAASWVPKDRPVQELLHAIRCVARGETYVPGRLLTEVVQTMSQSRRGWHSHGEPLSRLTPREQDVLRCLVNGLNRHQISQALTISPDTVRTHLQNILSKLGVHSSLAAAAYARKYGLGEIDAPVGSQRKGNRSDLKVEPMAQSELTPS